MTPDEQFRWSPGTEDDGGHVDFLVRGVLLGRVRRCLSRWEFIARVGEQWVLACPRYDSETQAREAMVTFWRAAAQTAKELGL